MSVKLAGSQGLSRPWCGDSLKSGKKLAFCTKLPFLSDPVTIKWIGHIADEWALNFRF